MKSIFKKEKLFFISLIGIVITSSFLVFSYAYQKVKVDYTDTSKTGMTVSVGKLDVSFTTTNRINISNMSLMNDYKTSNYTEFTIDNTKSTKDIFYRIKLSSLEYSNSLVTEDFKYTLTEVVDNKESIIGSGDFKFLNNTSHNICFNENMKNHIEQGKTKTLRLYLWLKETNKNQNNLENTSFKGKIEINSYLSSEFNKLTLSNLRIYGNSIQDGIPTAENPIEIKSLGENSKNLFNSKQLLNASGWQKNETEYFGSSAQLNVVFGNSRGLNFNIPKLNTEKQVTLSYTAKNGSGTGNPRFVFEYDDGTIENKSYINVTEFKKYTITSTLGKNISKISWNYGSDSTIYFKDIQLEYGIVSTEYRPYRYIDIVSGGKNLSSINEIITGATQYGLIDVPSLVAEYNSLPIGTIVTMSYDVKCNGTLGTNARKVFLLFSDGSTAGAGYSFIKTDKIATSVYLYGGRVNDTTYNRFFNIQMEIGANKTNYEPYQEPITTTINLNEHESLKKVGDVSDYIDLSAGKLVRKIGVIESYNGETINGDYISTTGALTNGATVYYVLDEEIIENVDSTLINQIYNSYYINATSIINSSKIEYSI